MADVPMSVAEFLTRMERAAIAELAAINIMECGAVRVGAPFVLTDVVINTRRQAQALGIAHQVALKLKADPSLAEALGIAGIIDCGAGP